MIFALLASRGCSSGEAGGQIVSLYYSLVRNSRLVPLCDLVHFKFDHVSPWAGCTSLSLSPLNGVQNSF